MYEEIKKTISTAPEYDFLRTNPHLGDNIILLGLGGSYAYGTNVEGSDVDLRGCAVNTARDILTGKDFEQVDVHDEEKEVDTVIYSFDKLVRLLCQCNPNIIELLGLEPNQYLYLSDAGRILIENRQIFLSKRAAFTFGGYAVSQLRKLQNKTMRGLGDEEKETHILRSIQHAEQTFREQVAVYPDDAFHLYVDEAPNAGSTDRTHEMYADIRLNHYPLRDLSVLWNDVSAIVRDYDSLGKRNQKAMEHGKLCKHAMHLIRIYMMDIDILEKGEIITKRPEHDFLMSIRNGAYMNENGEYEPEFYKIVDDLEKRMDAAVKTSSLPDTADMDKVRALVEKVNLDVIRKQFC